MNDIINKVLQIALIVALCVFGFKLLTVPESVQPEKAPEDNLGGGVSQDHFVTERFFGGLVEGGITSTTTAGTVVLPATAFDDEKVVTVLPTSATTITLPASSTMAGIIPTPGQTRTFIIHNRGTSTSNSIAIAGGTGIFLKRGFASSTINGDTDGGSVIAVTLTRLFNNNITAFTETYGD